MKTLHILRNEGKEQGVQCIDLQRISVTLKVEPNFSSYKGRRVKVGVLKFRSSAGFSYKRETCTCDDGTLQTPQNVLAEAQK